MSAELIDVAVFLLAACSVLVAGLITLGAMKPRRAATVRPPLTLEDRRSRAVRWVVVLAWAACTIPSLIQNLTMPRRAGLVAEASVSSPIASLAAYGSVGLLLIYCIFQIVGSKTRPVPQRLVGVCLVIFPWVTAVVSSISAGGNIPVNALALPTAAIALWRLNAKLQDLIPVAWLTGLTATMALAMGVFIPARGLLHGSSGALATADKALLGDTLLAGPFNHSNELGLVLALGFPAILLLRGKRARLLIFALVALALVWSASRGSLAAVAVSMVAVWVLSGFKVGSARASLAFFLAIAAATVVAYIPLTTDTLDAYSDRGQIWRASLEAWAESPAFGNGYSWYGDIGKLANSMTAVSFNGHNLFVHIMVTGGVVLLLVMITLSLRVITVAAAAAKGGELFPFAYLVSFFLVAALEVPTRFRDVDPYLWVCVVPLVVIAMVFRTSPPEEVELSERAEVRQRRVPLKR